MARNEGQQVDTLPSQLYGWTGSIIKKLLVNASGALGVFLSSPTTIGHGSKDVTTAGTEVALATTTSCSEVLITAKESNTGKIYIGGVGVSSSTGSYIYAGGTTKISIDDLSKIYIDAENNGEGVQYTYVA